MILVVAAILPTTLEQFAATPENAGMWVLFDESTLRGAGGTRQQLMASVKA